MESFNNQRKVQQGEDWNLDVLLSASDVEYIPFIVSSKLKNPYFVVTIASTKYEKNLRYVKSWWNDPIATEKLVTFFTTEPHNCGELTDPSQVQNYLLITKETSSDTAGGVQKYTGENHLYQYTLSTDTRDKYDADEWRQEWDEAEKLGHKPYHYSYYNWTAVGQDLSQVERLDDVYECHVRFNFNTEQTGEWNSQNYLYQISLVSGELMDTVISQIENEHQEVNWPVAQKDKYKLIKENWPTLLQSDIDADSPLGRIELVVPIMQPTKLEVFNNLRTLI